MAPEPRAFRRRLLRWYDRVYRQLPWRAAPNAPSAGNQAWQILVSEIMLQQTRVEAVIPYYERFLSRFPTARDFAAASESDALAAWSGLGYYSRARNLQRTAALVADGFPNTYEAIRELPGVGPYTAAAVASIAFQLAYAAVDGNVLRVVARVFGDSADIGDAVTRARFTKLAQELLDMRRPGDFNQAMMELGATICLPRAPRCLLCPVAQDCVARQQGIQNELPVKLRKIADSEDTLDVVIAERGEAILLRQRGPQERRMAGFWELPLLSAFRVTAGFERVASFRHTIVHTTYTVTVWRGPLRRTPAGMRWTLKTHFNEIPLTTISRKALARVPAK